LSATEEEIMGQLQAGELAESIVRPQLVASDLRMLLIGPDDENYLKKEAKAIVEAVEPEIANAITELAVERTAFWKRFREICLVWMEFAVKIMVIWLLFSVSMMLLRQSNEQIYAFLEKTFSSEAKEILIAVIGGAIIEIFRFLLSGKGE